MGNLDHLQQSIVVCPQNVKKKNVLLRTWIGVPSGAKHSRQTRRCPRASLTPASNDFSSPSSPSSSFSSFVDPPSPPFPCCSRRRCRHATAKARCKAGRGGRARQDETRQGKAKGEAGQGRARRNEARQGQKVRQSTREEGGDTTIGRDGKTATRGTAEAPSLASASSSYE